LSRLLREVSVHVITVLGSDVSALQSLPIVVPGSGSQGLA
jgi:hypothetical protein